MSTYDVSVKWGKETIEIKYDPSTGVKGLKAELQERTDVPADRMKVMAKSKGLWKGVLKDDTDVLSFDWTVASAKGPVQLLLMGSAAKLDGPKQKTVFLEDLPAEEVAKVQEPSGLVNLGVSSLRLNVRVFDPITNILTHSQPEYVLSKFRGPVAACGHPFA